MTISVSCSTLNVVPLAFIIFVLQMLASHVHALGTIQNVLQIMTHTVFCDKPDMACRPDRKSGTSSIKQRPMQKEVKTKGDRNYRYSFKEILP